MTNFRLRITKLQSVAIVLVLSLITRNSCAFAAGGTDGTTAAQYLSQIYTGYVWPFIYFMIALNMYLGIMGLIRALVNMSAHSDNPQVREHSLVTIKREFVIMAALGSFGLLFSLVISCLTYA